MATTIIEVKNKKNTPRVEIVISYPADAEADKQNTITIPWAPDSIAINGNETRVAEYEIIGKGQYQVPMGRNLKSVSWQSIFPGDAHKTLPFIDTGESGEVESPQYYVDLLDTWKCKGTVVNVLVHQIRDGLEYIYFYDSCLLSDYSANIDGPVGDIGYNVTFTEYRTITMRWTHKSKAIPKTYKVKSGDTLYKISMKYWGNGGKANSIYKWNKKKIDGLVKKKKGKAKTLYKGTKLYLYDTKKKTTLFTYTGKYPTKTLNKRSKGKQVKLLQKWLLWYYPTCGVTVNGKFDSPTAAAVNKFRKASKLPQKGKAKGKVDKKFIKKMKSARQNYTVTTDNI